MTQATLIRARYREGRTLVRVLMSHPMESGHRQDESGQTVPAWHIREVEVRCQGTLVLRARWGPSVSRDPYLEFTLRQAQVGDRIAVKWVDNRGDMRVDEAGVEAG
jgi:sulfur-oxidizing protein SoxZ